MKNIYPFFFITILIMSSCTKKSDNIKNQSIKILDKNWQFTEVASEEWKSARIPGTVHTDLINHNMIPDPFIGFNEDSVQWIENRDWMYKTVFHLNSNDISYKKHELVFEGLDTYADVYLNDSLIIKADNMFVPWATDCADLLKPGENEIRIYFHSAVKKGLEKARKLDYLLIATNEQAPDDKKTNVFTRKAPFHFGWDWGPRLVTCGIWRPVYLKSWNNAVIRDIHLVQKEFIKDKASYDANMTIDVEKPGRYLLQAKDSQTGLITEKFSRLVKGRNEVSLELVFEDPQLWWSNGLGEAHLYEIDFHLQKRSNSIDSVRERLGIRTIELVQKQDKTGRTFQFELNGIPVFMKGANYIPGDIFIPRVSKEKYKRVIEEAVKANMNMLRVWGGAIYENDIFYELCDENGILVWQDFMFACAMQPGDSAHLNNIQKEAEYNVKRLRNHPCMALWCGNNENLVAWHKWGWQDQYTEEQNEFHWQTYKNIFYKILPDAVEKFDPEKTYWPSSPQSFGDKLPDRKSGDEHDWTIWFGQKEYEAYAENVPRFVSEYGLQSFPPKETMLHFASEDDLKIFSDLIDHRQRSNMNWIEPGFNGNDMILRYLKKYLPGPENFDELIYLSQVSHQLAMKEAIEAHRRNMPVCMGSLYWQINDCWPTVSWASVDYFGRWKAPHYQAKRSFDPILLAEERKDNRIVIKLVSDFLEDRKMNLQLHWMKNNGYFVGTSVNKEVTIEANSVTIAWEDYLNKNMLEQLNTLNLIARLFEDNELVAEKVINFVRPEDEVLQRPEIEATVTHRAGEYIIDIESQKPAKFVFIDFEETEGWFDDNFFHLSPDNPKRIIFYTDEKISSPEKKLKIISLFQYQ